MVPSDLSFGLAFIAGLASFLSPCVFSLVPAYIGYLGGRSAATAERGGANRWVTFSHGLAFVFGFSLIFVLLGVAASALGGLLYDLSIWLAKVGGIVVIIFGLYMTGILKKAVNWLHQRFPSGTAGEATGFLVQITSYLDYDLRPQTAPDRRMGYLSSALMGVFFSAGWSPCVGPILGLILTLAFQGGSVFQGVTLLSAYSAGLAIPFLVAATQISLVTTIIRRYGKLMHYVEVGMGILMIVVGIMLFQGTFVGLARYSFFFPSINEVTIGRTLLAVVLAAAVLGLIPAYIAYRKGRNFYDWWFFGAGLFVIALPMALFIQPVVGSNTVEPGQKSAAPDTARTEIP